MLPLIVNGETVEMQQIIFIRYFQVRIKLLNKLKLLNPVLLFPIEICTDTPKIAKSAYRKN